MITDSIRLPGEGDSRRERVLGLFRFLRDLSVLRSAAVLDIDLYDKVLWLARIPRESGCFCRAWQREARDDTEQDAWIDIVRPRLPDPPKVPSILAPWVARASLEDSSREAPEIAPHRVAEQSGVAGPETVVESLADRPDVSTAFRDYVEAQWKPWAETHRRIRSVHAVYADLFSIRQAQERLGEQFEVVLAQGLVTWEAPSGRRIRRHLLTSRVDVELDSHTGRIRVGPAAAGAATTLETEMFEAGDLPDARLLEELQREAGELAESVWDPARVGSILGGWAHAMAHDAVYEPSLDPPLEFRSRPIVHAAPALILRRRTQRTLARFFAELVEQIERGGPIPPGIEPFVEIPTGRLGDDEREGTPQPPGGQEVYFPLPANSEQRRIVERLTRRDGVLVQGPPGTGKSHTIVNLLCHLLANGQRVLVTSHTARALDVLRRYLSERVPEVAPLCVLLLGHDRAAMQSMEDSVQGITERYNNRDRGRTARRLHELKERLAVARTDEARLRREIREVREADTWVHENVPGGRRGTLQSIALELGHIASRHQWLRDRPAEDVLCSLTPEEAAELSTLIDDVGLDDAARAACARFEPDRLPSLEQLSRFVSQERERAKALEGSHEHRDHPALEALREVQDTTLAELVSRLDDLLRCLDGLVGHVFEWTDQAAVDVLGDQDRHWRTVHEITTQKLQGIDGKARDADETRVTGLEESDADLYLDRARDLLNHFAAGRGLGIWPFRAQAVRSAIELVRRVRVDGRPCRDRQAAARLVDWLEVRRALRDLDLLWQPIMFVQAASCAGREACYRDCLEPLEQARTLHDKRQALRAFVATIPRLPEPRWHEAKELRAFRAAASLVSAERLSLVVRRQIEEVRAPLEAAASSPHAAPEIRELLAAFDRRDVGEYIRAHGTALAVAVARQRRERRNTLLTRLSSSAPLLAAELAGWDSRDRATRLAALAEAWEWRKAQAWVARRSQRGQLEAIGIRLDRVRDTIRNALGSFAAERAWEHCFERMTAAQAEHLIAWSKAVKRIGKGTGKYAAQHRRAAQEHMDSCREAIPAWILPLYRVAESLRPDAGQFDVAIIDEASQSGPEALMILALAKKVVVVGDDKQISPENVGVSPQEVNVLRQRHLRDVPHSDSIGLDASFFDLAEIRFQPRIRLREHFRCMPEIIQFSNNLCYEGEPLIPLRQYGSGRIRPVVEAVHVPDGFRDGATSPQNPPEAVAIVDRIASMCADSRFDGKTIGVISLQGERQAHKIEAMLLERLRAEELSERRIVCGDAYAFQGDERDVILLSLVAAPHDTHRIGVLGSDRDKRRFNVAASRAREQMILFHTATLNDLSPACVRHALLKYCLSPRVETDRVGDLDVPQLRHLARLADRDRTDPPEPFESWFELDVFLNIVGHGYRVSPQYDVAGYRIDLVVEGMKGRLGVECDGDRWHGPERHEHDMDRQRELERCGWTIWRVRGGEYYLNPESALESLWNSLGRRGIHPGSADVPPSVVVSAPVGSTVTTESALPHHALHAGEGGLPRIADGAQGEGPLPRIAAPIDELPRVAEGTEHSGRHIEREVVSPPSREQAVFLDAAGRSPPEGSRPTWMEPYENWAARPLPDPRSSTPAELVEPLVEIIRSEGPMYVHRAYRLLANAGGVQRVGRQVRKALNHALASAQRSGRVEVESGSESREMGEWIVRVPSAPAVRLREIGDRTFHEIPGSEVTEAMRRLVGGDPDLDDESAFRRVLDVYGIRRMSTQIRDALRKIREAL